MDWSNIIEVKTLPDENAPTKPTGFKVKTQNASSVVLNWTASTDNSMTRSIPPQISAIRIRKAPFNICF